MTIKQIQNLLAYLGYYVGDIDGQWGTLSKTACKAFQSDFGLDADGIAGSVTQKALKHAVAYGIEKKVTTEETAETTTAGTFWDEIKYFTREEFRCQCGGKYCNGFPVEPNPVLLSKLDLIREKLGVPITIVESGGSGVRCTQHNANVGGVSNSQHLYGTAADLHSSASPQRMKEVAETVMGDTGGIGLYDWGIHVDTRATKARWNG